MLTLDRTIYSRIKSLSLKIVAAIVVLPLSCFSAEDAPRLNFIVILADDMGVGDIGAYRELFPGGPEDVPASLKDPGYPGDLSTQLAYRFTPNLDRLAREGVRFTRAYTGSWCAPSRQALLSGQWSSRASAYEYPWIGQQLREVGYVTGMVGKTHGSRPTQRVVPFNDPQSAEFDDGLFFIGGARGFYMEAGESLPGRVGTESSDYVAKEGDYITEVFTDHAVDFIERHSDTPFFLYLAHTAPHEPLHGKPEDLKSMFPDVYADRSNASIIDEVAGNRFRAVPEQTKAEHYAAMVYNMDAGIGRIMDTLKRKDLHENTLIIFTCDNGAQWGSNYPFSGHKTETRDGGIRVPFIVWSHGIASSDLSGSVQDALVSVEDITPTLMALATEEPYAYPTDGVDLSPYLAGNGPSPSGKSWFFTTTLSGNSLRSKVHGVEEFSDDPLPETMIQTVYVSDDEKVTSWNASGTSSVGAVFHQLPNVAGMRRPYSLIVEEPPVSGETPTERRGRELFEEMKEMIRKSDGELLPTWSGDPSVQRGELRWWIDSSR